MRRRDFLRGAAALGGAAAVGGITYALLDDNGNEGPQSILDGSPKDSPIDTIVVLMLENRSFDHYYGWLGADEAYLEAGRRRYGKHFHIKARTNVVYTLPDGTPQETSHLVGAPDQPDPFRGCGHPIPGHGWFAGRAQRDRGFLGRGTGNDSFAVGYYEAEDLPVHTRLAQRFTVLDTYHASLLAGTFPNREYQHAATSEGTKGDPVPLDIGTFRAPTIWDKLGAAGVSAGYYYTDLPVLLLWGERLTKFITPIDRYFEQAAAGTLPNVVFVDPGFGPPLRTDDHPLGDIRLGQRFLREVFKAFTESPQWKRGAFFMVYDEWGGFFDHVPPPVLPDKRESPIDADNFGQAGFRVPAILASPYGMRGGVDHTVYDHTSILRFLEWRFLGAPAHGPGKDSDTWFLTTRDRFANNIGLTLRSSDPEPDLEYDAAVPVSPFTLPCDEATAAQAQALLENSDPFVASEQLGDEIARKYPKPTLTPWIEEELLPILKEPGPGTERGAPIPVPPT